MKEVLRQIERNKERIERIETIEEGGGGQGVFSQLVAADTTLIIPPLHWHNPKRRFIVDGLVRVDGLLVID